jgi:hypothetical protein
MPPRLPSEESFPPHPESARAKRIAVLYWVMRSQSASRFRASRKAEKFERVREIVCQGRSEVAHGPSHSGTEIPLSGHKDSMDKTRRVFVERVSRAAAQDKLFHVVVVLGSAMITGGACSAQSTSRGERHHGGGNAGAADAGSSGIGGTSTGGVIATGGLGAIPNAGGTGGGGMTGGAGSGGVPPQCDAGPGGEMSASGAPSSPDDCVNGAQFRCAQYEPEPLDCACDPVAPLAAECCPPGERFFCRGGYDPPIGCVCEISIITR